MRLIDADALGNRMYHESFEKDSDLQRWDGGCWIRYKLFEQVLRAAPTIDLTHPTPSNTLGALDCVERQDAINAMEKINRVFNDLGLSCAYDMPSFWCHGGKDYKVIPTKYHKGYQQALSDAEKRIKLILEELCYG